MTKKGICSIVFLLLSLYCFSQDTIITYLDKNLEKTDQEKALIKRTIVKIDSNFLVIDRYVNGKLRNVNKCSSIDPWIENGFAKHYKYGLLYSSGKYKDGKLTGKWDYSSITEKDIIDYSDVEEYLLKKDFCKDSSQIDVGDSENKEIHDLKSELKNFLYNNMHYPARIIRDKGIFEIKANLTIDTSGYVKCPEIENKYNIDYTYEALRVLFLFRSDLRLAKPARISIPINFEATGSYLVPEVPATFKGGDLSTFYQYIQLHLVYPKEAKKNKVEGKVYVGFVIGTDGLVVNAKVLKGVSPELDKEAVRCIINSPAWEPAKQGGKLVKQMFTVPVPFTLY